MDRGICDFHPLHHEDTDASFVVSTFQNEGDSVHGPRRRSRPKKPLGDERTMISSPEHGLATTRLPYRRQAEDVFSIPSSPEPQGSTTFGRSIRRVRSEEGSVPSSPEPGIFQTSPSVGGRRSIGEDPYLMAMFSPDHQLFTNYATRALAQDDGPFISSCGSPENMPNLQQLRRFPRKPPGDASLPPTLRHGADRILLPHSPEQSPPLRGTLDGQPPLPFRRRPFSQAEDGEADSGTPDHLRANADSDASSSRGRIGDVLERYSHTWGRAGSSMLSPDTGLLPRSSGTPRSGGTPRSCGTPTHDAAKPERPRRISPAEVSDETASKVKAMMEQLRSERFPNKEKKEDAAASSQRTQISDRLKQQAAVCPWCRKPSAPAAVRGSSPEESYLRRFDRLGIDYTRPGLPGLESSADAAQKDAGLRLFLRTASEQEMTPAFRARTNSAVSNDTGTAQSPSLPLLPSLPISEWQIDYSELRIGVRVGIGSFGEVFRGTWRGTEVAIKRLLEQDLTQENMEDFCNEINLLSRLRHPNVILFLGACTKPPHLSMVTELMHMGSLYRLIHTSGLGAKLSWRRRLRMLRDICRGMMCVQRMRIVHCDLKSANCLVDKHWTVKVCDFGLSRTMTDSAAAGKTAAGTPEWMAPELLRNEPVTEKCDIFSFGVIMWELCTLKRPWAGYKPRDIVYAVANGNRRLDAPEGLIGKLISDCWAEAPADRPSYEEILTRLHECEFLESDGPR